MNKQEVLSRGFITRFYTGHIFVRDANYYADGYFNALHDSGFLSEEEYMQALDLNHEIYIENRHNDNGE